MPTRRQLLASLAAGTALTFARPTPPDSMMGPGVSRELATERAANLSGVRYHMDLWVVSRDTAHGTIAISFTAKRPRDVILDFRGPRLAEVRVNGAAAATEFNGAHLPIPASAVSPPPQTGAGGLRA